MKISRIVSGGQLGVDIGALDGAIYANFPHGGFCPKGRRSEKGRIPDIYHLVETKTDDYRERTELNVINSTATLIFTDGKLSGGSKLTAGFAKKHKKPCLHIDLSQEEQRAPNLVTSYRQPHVIKKINDWMDGIGQENIILNVAGNRESKSQGIQGRVKVLIVDLLIATKSATCYGINNEG